MIAYLVGGLGVSLIVGWIILFVLEEVGAGRSLPAEIEIAVGALAILVAVLVGSGAAARLVPSRGGAKSTAGDTPAAGERSGLQQAIERLPGPVQRALATESPWVAWIAGVAVGMPTAYYLAAIAILLQAAAGFNAQILGLLLFNVVSFAIVEIPLIGFLFAPDETRARVAQFYGWIYDHRRSVIAGIAGAVGVFLLALGVSKLG